MMIVPILGGQIQIFVTLLKIQILATLLRKRITALLIQKTSVGHI